jgi:hypothetical protein
MDDRSEQARARRRPHAAVVIAIVLGLVAASAFAIARRGADESEAIAAGTTTTTRRASASETKWRPTSTTTTVPETTTSTTEAPPTTLVAVTTPPPPPPPTTTAAPPVTAAAPAPAPAPPPAATAGAIPYFAPGGVEPYRGLGVWLDVLDWSPSYVGTPPVAPSAVERMADLGVQTIYIQTSRFNRPEDILDPLVLGQFIDRAHARGLKVVAWYMPTHEDQETDVRRLVAAANLPVDGVCVNIESTRQPDIALRNARLLDLSYRVRQATTKSMSAVVIPPVVTELLNRNYWPNFPWKELAGTYDVWMPMAYWSNRTLESGWRDGYRYIAENTTMIRTLTGRADAAVHPVGGIGNEITVDEVNAMALALNDTGAIGGSIYDYATTGDALWPSLHNFRR